MMSKYDRKEVVTGTSAPPNASLSEAGATPPTFRQVFLPPVGRRLKTPREEELWHYVPRASGLPTGAKGHQPLSQHSRALHEDSSLGWQH